MLKSKPRNFDKDYKEKNSINSWKSVDSSGKFLNNGVFSEKIFGFMSNATDYSCECGKYQTEFNLGVTCEECNEKVTFKGLMLSKEGWIDLQFPIIHPVFFQYLKKIIGATNLNNILHYKPKRGLDGFIIESKEENFANSGMSFFIENFRDIVDYFMVKRKTSKEIERQKCYDFIMENESLVFITKFPVINSRLRPAMLVNGEFTFDEISNVYNNLIRNSEEIKNSPDIQLDEVNVLDIAYKNQYLVNDVYERILDNLSNKEGFIRGSLIGNRLNLTSRSVISPLPAGYSMDSCVLPYRTAIDLFKPIIIQKLVKIKKITIMQASQLWFSATLEFNPLIHKIMNEVIKGNNVRIILNRNPTINIGSMLMLSIDEVKDDLKDSTINVSNIILPALGADFDGDVLNVVLLLSTKFVKLFSGFSPSNLVLDPCSGQFNENFNAFKDILIGCETLMLM